MSKVVKREGSRLPLASEWLARLHVNGDDPAKVDVGDGRLIVRPVAAAQDPACKARVAEHLRLPAGSLSHLVKGVGAAGDEWDWTADDVG